MMPEISVAMFIVPVCFLCAVINMIIGFLWYSPLMFGKPWAKMMGMNDMSPEEMKKGLAKIYGLTFLTAMWTSFILLIVLNGLISGSVKPQIQSGIFYGVAIWIGFVSTVQFTNWLFTKKPFKLFLIDTGYQLASYVVLSTFLSYVIAIAW